MPARHGSLPAPSDTRPYRLTSAAGHELVHVVRDESGRWFRRTWRQIGWHGQSGALYALGEKPSAHEPGSWAPLYVQVDADEVDPPEAVAEAAIERVRAAIESERAGALESEAMDGPRPNHDARLNTCAHIEDALREPSGLGIQARPSEAAEAAFGTVT